MNYKITNMASMARTVRGQLVQPYESIILTEPYIDGSLKCELIEEIEQKKIIKEEIKDGRLAGHVESKSSSKSKD